MPWSGHETELTWRAFVRLKSIGLAGGPPSRVITRAFDDRNDVKSGGREVSRSLNLRRVARKFHRTIMRAVEQRGDFVLLFALRQDFCREDFRIVLRTVAEESYVGVVPSTA